MACFSHRCRIKVLRTEKCARCLLHIPLSHSHEDPDAIGTDHPSSSSLQDHGQVWERSDLFFKWSLNETFLEIIRWLLEKLNEKKTIPIPKTFCRTSGTRSQNSNIFCSRSSDGYPAQIPVQIITVYWFAVTPYFCCIMYPILLGWMAGRSFSCLCIF